MTLDEMDMQGGDNGDTLTNAVRAVCGRESNHPPLLG